MSTFLKRLELQGFKSFAQKTDFEFPFRVAGVVGPNGSGKSNVIDALRWVLGEREAKQLRGDTLGNLIFAGTPKRAAVGFAKVSLLFDNRERLFPIDAPEVMLTRRIDRTGNSQFFLQDAEIRLKDLQPILARAKLGARGLTMIGQGQSDLFVRSTPEERRLMIEEILGLREYRLKKNQAERQLNSSEVNMEKVAAMLEELSPHLRFLRKQKNRFEKRVEIEKDLRIFENAYFAHHFHTLNRDIAAFDGPYRETEGMRETKEKEVFSFEQELKEINQKTGDADRAKQLRVVLSEFFMKRGEIEKALARAEAKLEFQAIPTTHAERSAGEMKLILETLESELKIMEGWDELEKVKQSIRLMVQRVSTFFHKEPEVKGDTTSIREEINVLRANLETIENQIKSIRAEEESFAAEQQHVNQEFRAKVEILEMKKNELRKLDQTIQQYRFDRERLTMRMEELERDWAVLGRPVEELRSITEVQDIVEFGDLERKMLRFRGELAAIGEIDTNLVKEAEDTEARYTFLNKELEDLTKAIADLRSLIKELDHKIHSDFKSAFHSISDEFNNFFRLMFGGGKAKLTLKYPEIKIQDVIPAEGEEKKEVVEEEEKKDKNVELSAGVEIDITIPRKKIGSLEMLSGGEKSLVSLAALFALISVSPPPFLVLDEIDAPLDEENARRFSELVKAFSKKTQFIIVTHNRATMEAADVLYGVTMGDDGVSKILSLKLDTAS
ncbi:MAG: AAA family ATPase [Candidatus Paceibacterota bacterium]|jgi:chromosome segregation protein